jgi:hypothetical protein
LINVTVDDLSVADTTTLSYDITAYIVSSANGSVQKLQQQKFTTLMPDYRPEAVTQIEARNWTDYFDENEQERRLNFTFTWRPERSHTCHYEVVFYDEDVMETYPVPIDRLFEYTMSNLKYNNDYSVSIRAINSHDPSKFSRESWITFESPEGEVDLNSTAIARHIEGNNFDVEVLWTRPREFPDHYQIDVKNLHSSTLDNYVAIVNGVSWIFLRNIFES